MAFLRKIKGRYYVYFTDNLRQPKQKSVALGTGLKSAAILKKNELERRFADPDDPYDPWFGDVTPRHLSFKQAEDLFLESRGHLRPKTVEAYAEVLRNLRRRLPPKLMLAHLKPNHLREYVLLDTTVTVATRRKRFTHLRAFLRWAVKMGLISRNPLDKVQQPKAEKKAATFLTAEDIERLLLAIDYHEENRRSAAGKVPDVGWLRDIIQVGVCTGLRRSELVNLRWSDVDLVNNFIVVRNSEGFKTKSGHERRVPVAGPALEVLQRLRSGRADDLDGPVFVDRDGLPVKPDRVSKRFKFFARLAKLDERLHFHSLRHTTGSWLAMKGVPLRVIQAILGHASITTTEIYSHLLPDTMQAAVQQTFGRD